MKRYFSVAGGVLGWVLGVVVPVYGRWPRIWYDPAGRRWFWAASAPPVPIGYYSLLFSGLAGAAVGAVLGRVLGRRAGGEAVGLALAWVLTALVVGCAYFAWNLWPWTKIR